MHYQRLQIRCFEMEMIEDATQTGLSPLQRGLSFRVGLPKNQDTHFERKFGLLRFFQPFI